MLINYFKKGNEEILNIAYEKALIKAGEIAAAKEDHLKRKEKYLKRVANSKKLRGKGKR